MKINETMGDDDSDGITNVLDAYPYQKDLYLEIDYFYDLYPSKEALDYLVDYYKNNLGITVHYTIDRGMSVYPTSREWLNLGGTIGHHDIQWSVHVIYVYDIEFEPEAAGYAALMCGAVIAWDHVHTDYLLEASTLMHEIGHCIGMSRDTPEKYCTVYGCAMGYAITYNIEYCSTHASKINLKEKWGHKWWSW